MAARLKAAGFADADLHPFAAPDHPKEGGLVAVYPGNDPKAQGRSCCSRTSMWSRPSARIGRAILSILVEENGNFYARGAIDDKAEAAIWVDTLIRYKHENYHPPRRTIKLALTCGEETAGAFNGAQWLTENQRDLIDAAFAVNEGAFGELDAEGHKVALEVAGRRENVAEFPPGSHQPRRPQLAAAQGQRDLPAGRGAAAHRRLRVPGAVHRRQPRLFHRHGADPGGQGQQRRRRGHARAGQRPERPAAIALVSAKDPSWNATLRTTCVATMLDAGHATNALPQRARANINCRIFPGVAAETGARQARGIGRRPRRQGFDAGDPRSELAAAASDRANHGAGSEAGRGILPRRAGAAHPAAGRDRRRVPERGAASPLTASSPCSRDPISDTSMG